MNELKNKIMRKLRSFHVGTLGAIATGLAVINCLVALGFYATSSANMSDSIYQLILTAINCLFYLMLTKNFLVAKESNRLGLVNQNLLIICIFEYIFPAIDQLVFGLAGNGLSGLNAALVTTLFSSSLAGILYFVFLGKLNRSESKSTLTILKVLGVIIFVANVANASLYFADCANITFNISGILYLCYSILKGLTSILFGTVFLLYPFFTRREEKYGY